MPEQKAAKAFIESSYHKLWNPYQFADTIRLAGVIPSSALHRVSIGWFHLMEIEHRYGIGDPLAGEMGSRIVSEVLSDYAELPDYNPGRGFENQPNYTERTFAGYEPSISKTFVRRGPDI